jgi:predicted nucleic acid-binding protein
VTIEALGRTYFDVNIFIYVIEAPEPFTRYAQQILLRLSEEGQVPVTSEFSLAECLVGARKASLPVVEKLYIGHFEDRSAVECVPLTRDLLIAAARAAGDTRMRLSDSIHVATAVATGCQSFVTNDRRLKLPPSITRVPLMPTSPAGS